MKLRLLLLTSALAAPLAFAVEEKTTIQKTFPVDRPEAARLEIDNVTGGIRVTGYDGREVQVTVRQAIEAESQEKIQEARRDVRLDMSQQGSTVRLYVDGPFRCKCPDGGSYRRSGHPGYEVRYDFDVRVPRPVAIFLRTVTDGDIHVAGVSGNYDVENVNGGIEVLDAAGESGHAYAINGGVKVTFTRNPRAVSLFGSLNGPVDLLFQPDLAADFRMKTFNGNIYSDFPVTALPAGRMVAEQRNGRHVFKADRFTGARVGAGGPEIKLDGFNGDIHILKRSN